MASQQSQEPRRQFADYHGGSAGSFDAPVGKAPLMDTDALDVADLECEMSTPAGSANGGSTLADRIRFEQGTMAGYRALQAMLDPIAHPAAPESAPIVATPVDGGNE